MLGSIWDEGSFGGDPFTSLQKWGRNRSRPDPWEGVRSTSLARQPLLSQAAAPEPLWASAGTASSLQRVREAASGLGRTVGPSAFPGRVELAPESLVRAGDTAPAPAWGGWADNPAKIESALTSEVGPPLAMGSGGLTTGGDIDPWQTPRGAWVAQPSPELSFGARANGAIYDAIYGSGQAPARPFPGFGRDVPLPTEVLVEAAIARRNGQPAARLGGLTGSSGQSMVTPATSGIPPVARAVATGVPSLGMYSGIPAASREGELPSLGFRAAAGAPPGSPPDEPPNMSDGGPGTSSAKGQAAINRGRAKRGMVEGLDSFLAFPAQGVGVATEQGLRDAAAMAYRKGFRNVGGMLKGASGMARWAAPAGAFAATTGLPAVLGAIEGGETAGVGGAAIQGGAALAGGLIGQAMIPVPFLGAAVGSAVGGFLGGGLTKGAVSAVEKAQAGDSGTMGAVGRGLDAFIDTPFEKEQKAILQQMNSPAMQAVRMQEETRRLREESARRQMVFEQAALQGLL